MEADAYAAAQLGYVHGRLRNEKPIGKQWDRARSGLEAGLHTLFIGEIKDVKADPSILNEKGNIDAEKIQAFSFFPGTWSFYKSGGLLGKIGDLRQKVE